MGHFYYICAIQHMIALSDKSGKDAIIGYDFGDAK